MNITKKDTMLTGKDLILATKPFAREIRAKSWFHTLSTLLLLSASLFATVVLNEWYFRVPLSIVSGLLIVRMFIIYHDHQHHSILTRSVPADLIMKAFGLFILSPSSIWKRSHDHHHNHNSKLFSASIGSYPISTKKKFLDMDPKERFAYLAVRHPLTIFSGYLSMFIYGMCIRSFSSNPRKHLDSLVALILHAIMSVAVIYFLGWPTWFFAILIPFSIACGLGAYLFYAQHNFPGVTFSDNKDWTYERAALESSSFMKMNPVMDWFTGNIGYHHVHHLNAKIPFYRLSEAMDHFPELQNCKITTLRLKDIKECLALKVWDPEQNRMITLKEIRKEQSA